MPDELPPRKPTHGIPRAQLPGHLKPFLKSGAAVSILGKISKEKIFGDTEALHVFIPAVPPEKRKIIAEMIEKKRKHFFSPEGFEEIDSRKFFGYGERLGNDEDTANLVRNLLLGYIAHNQPLEELIKHFRQ